MTLEPSPAQPPATAGRTAPRELIFDAATRLFGERGYTGTTMRDIAKAVGILPGSLYAHIHSKDAVLLEIIESGVDRFNAAADRVEEQAQPAADALQAVIREHLRIVAENPQRTLVVFHQWRFLDEPHRSRLRTKRRHYEEFFSRTVRAGVADGEFDDGLDVKVAVLGILGALNWTPEWYSAEGPASPDQIADALAASLLSGLRQRA
ncbi:MAG: TetR/AcrR family transcriptional regulator [Pseudonocardia sp.]|nr:TetR/AcrR family transcriptional regulator [Pseudonocardia sp.]